MLCYLEITGFKCSDGTLRSPSGSLLHKSTEDREDEPLAVRQLYFESGYQPGPERQTPYLPGHEADCATRFHLMTPDPVSVSELVILVILFRF